MFLHPEIEWCDSVYGSMTMYKVEVIFQRTYERTHHCNQRQSNKVERIHRDVYKSMHQYLQRIHVLMEGCALDFKNAIRSNGD